MIIHVNRNIFTVNKERENELFVLAAKLKSGLTFNRITEVYSVFSSIKPAFIT